MTTKDTNLGNLADELVGEMIPQLNTRVGFRATSILEVMLRDYIRAHTKDGEYKGIPEYQQHYEKIVEYNRRGGATVPEVRSENAGAIYDSKQLPSTA